jgi:hypothetical protein
MIRGGFRKVERKLGARGIRETKLCVYVCVCAHMYVGETREVLPKNVDLS